MARAIRCDESSIAAAAAKPVIVLDSVIFQSLPGAELCTQTPLFSQGLVHAFFPPIRTVYAVAAGASLCKEVAIQHLPRPYRVFSDDRRRGNLMSGQFRRPTRCHDDSILVVYQGVLHSYCDPGVNIELLIQ